MNARPEPVDVLATLEGAGNFLITKGATPADAVALHEARAAIAELIDIAKDTRDSLSAANKVYADGAIWLLIERLTAALARVGGAL